MPLTIALIAHDRTKPALADWVRRNEHILAAHRIVATATTGSVIREHCPALELDTVKSGPLGGDQQIGAMIAEGRIDALVFFPIRSPPCRTMSTSRRCCGWRWSTTCPAPSTCAPPTC